MHGESVGAHPHKMTGLRVLSLAIVAMSALTACGGGGGAAISGVDNPTYTVGTYAASSTYAHHCANPRSGTSDVKGSITWENFWLRSWTHELYLWYSEVPDLKPSDYTNAETYFDLLKTNAVTPSGSAKDRFHFTYNTADWIALSQSGVSAGYGVAWVVLNGTIPRNVVVAYTQPNSPATNVSVNLARGETVTAVDGVSIDTNTSAGVDTLNAGLFPSNLNETHAFTIRSLNGSTRSVTMKSANVTETPVLNYASPAVIQNGSSQVGYLIFNDHFATAETELIQAFNTLQQGGVTDLVLDLRYNGGGYLDIASEIAYMIAGNARTNGRTFERLQFNSQYPDNFNPVTGNTNTRTPFHNQALGFSATPGTAFPSLNLNRVFVITGTGTCSASEAIINGLQGVGVQVIQIGSTTCGKPYGFYAADNCGTTYFSIQFQGVNDLGQGEYADGFTPNNSSSTSIARLPGCSVADDFSNALGSTLENRLKAALYYQANNACPIGLPAGSSVRAQIQSANSDAIDASDGELNKGAWRENRILGR